MKKRAGTAPLRVFGRSLLIGGSWNYSGMQNIGFAHSIAPAGEAYGEQEKREFLGRHMESFSTHPCMAGIIAGSVLKGEEEGRGRETPGLKEALAGPYAAMGDPFFSGSLRPLSSAAGVAAAATGWLLAPLMTVILYNLMSWFVRIGGFAAAYRDGSGGVAFLEKLALPETGTRLQWLSVLLLAVLAAGIVALSPGHQGAPLPWPAGALAMLALVMVCRALLARNVSVLVLLYGLALILFILAGSL